MIIYLNDKDYTLKFKELHVWDKAVESSTRNGRVATNYQPEVYACAIHYRKNVSRCFRCYRIVRSLVL